jgi:hypothetical protein
MVTAPPILHRRTISTSWRWISEAGCSARYRVQRRFADKDEDVSEWDLEYFSHPNYMRLRTYERLVVWRFASWLRLQISLAGVTGCHTRMVSTTSLPACIVWETTVESLAADDITRGLFFPANHRATSDRSHPPETCLPGNCPLFVQRKRVDRLTPTTRSTSAVLIL